VCNFCPPGQEWLKQIKGLGDIRPLLARVSRAGLNLADGSDFLTERRQPYLLVADAKKPDELKLDVAECVDQSTAGIVQVLESPVRCLCLDHASRVLKVN